MKEFKVLFICGFPLVHNSSVTFQNRSIIKGLKKLGFSVDVICPESEETSPVYDQSLWDIMDHIDRIYYIPLNTLYKKFLKSFSTKKQIPADSITNRKSSLMRTKKLLRKWLSGFLNFVDIDGSIRLSMNSVEKLELNLNEYELLISSSDPKCAHLIAKKLLHRMRGKKPFWIQYLGDPWFDDINLRGSWKKSIVYLLEKGILSTADRIIYTSPISLKRQIKLFPDYANKMFYANQASEIDTLGIEYETDTTNINPTIGYFGDYNSKIRNIIPFYKASDLLQDVKFLIAGCGNVDLKNKNNLTVINQRLRFDAIRKLEKETQILFAVCNAHGTQIPAKIYYWAGYRRKPIVVAVDGENKDEIKNFLTKFGRYIICENTVKSIVNGITEAIQNCKNGTVYDIPYELTCEGMVKTIIKGL